MFAAYEWAVQSAESLVTFCVAFFLFGIACVCVNPYMGLAFFVAFRNHVGFYVVVFALLFGASTLIRLCGAELLGAITN